MDEQVKPKKHCLDGNSDDSLCQLKSKHFTRCKMLGNLDIEAIENDEKKLSRRLIADECVCVSGLRLQMGYCNT
jgi:hypothetical protein